MTNEFDQIVVSEVSDDVLEMSSGSVSASITAWPCVQPAPSA